MFSYNLKLLALVVGFFATAQLCLAYPQHVGNHDNNFDHYELAVLHTATMPVDPLPTTVTADPLKTKSAPKLTQRDQIIIISVVGTVTFAALGVVLYKLRSCARPPIDTTHPAPNTPTRRSQEAMEYMENGEKVGATHQLPELTRFPSRLAVDRV